jgi:hypothetical protein
MIDLAAWHGPARHGSARLGVARLGEAGQGLHRNNQLQEEIMNASVTPRTVEVIINGRQRYVLAHCWWTIDHINRWVAETIIGNGTFTVIEHDTDMG